MTRLNDPNRRQGHLKNMHGSTTPHQSMAKHEWNDELRILQGKAVDDTSKSRNPSWNDGKAKKPHYMRKKVVN